MGTSAQLSETDAQYPGEQTTGLSTMTALSVDPYDDPLSLLVNLLGAGRLIAPHPQILQRFPH